MAAASKGAAASIAADLRRVERCPTTGQAVQLCTKPCRYFQMGNCKNGDRCTFLHTTDDAGSGGGGGGGGGYQPNGGMGGGMMNGGGMGMGTCMAAECSSSSSDGDPASDGASRPPEVRHPSSYLCCTAWARARSHDPGSTPYLALSTYTVPPSPRNAHVLRHSRSDEGRTRVSQITVSTRAVLSCLCSRGCLSFTLGSDRCRCVLSQFPHRLISGRWTSDD